MVKLSKVEYYMLEVDKEVYMRDLLFWYERVGGDWLMIRDKEKDGRLEMEFITRKNDRKIYK